VHVVRKQRVEVYLHPDTVAQLENDYTESNSAIIRQAVVEYLTRPKVGEEND